MTNGVADRGFLLLMLFAALLWGVYWIPVRELERLGLDGAWASFTLCASVLPPVLLTFLFRRPGAISARAGFGALVIGLAFALYGVAFTYTDVVRVVLFFYLAPAWSIAIECLFMGRRLTRRSVTALGLSFTGVVIICGGLPPLEGLGALGDWMALGSGLAWSAGAAIVFSGVKPDLRLTLIVSVLGAIAISGAAAYWGPPTEAASADLAELGPALLLALGFGALYVAPTFLLTLWGALALSPTTVTFLMTGEILSGVGSSAALAGEPFGLREIAGAGLIILGATFEVIWPQSQSSHPRKPPRSDSV